MTTMSRSVVTPIPDMTLYVGGADGVVDLSDKFRGLDMSFTATSSKTGRRHGLRGRIPR